MLSRKVLYVMALIAAFTTIINTAWTTFDMYSSDIGDVPRGEFLFSSLSPNNNYTVQMYLVDCGNTLGRGVRGEVIDMQTGQSRDIYWNLGEPNVIVGWLDEYVVDISGKSLNILTDKFDWRDYRNAI
ncbi:MAG TPA: DUF5412 domain-containing protein [Clostridiales bacterium]|nr:DUF5412 domain-containing protein [Clostridiales bacterium]